MDWPVIGSLTGVAVLAGVVGVGAYSALRSDEPLVRRSPSAPALLAAPQSGPALHAGPQQPYQQQARLQQPYQQQARPQQPYQPGRTLTLSRLTVEDAELDIAIRPRTFPVEPAPRLRLEPPPNSLIEREKESVTASLGPDHAEKNDRPPIVARPAPKKPQEKPHVEVHDRRVMTAGKIVTLRRTLRLLPDQLAHWRPVEAVLREIGREQLAQIRRGGKPEVGTGVMMRLYYAAQPLLGTLRPDQKERIRAMARSLGYGNVASML
jgi:hypothetical protein